ncbi:MAG TPA: sialate O-acetylesterase [Candidatus Paceibacterota bacterium]|jgi:hypothetical protein|nr:sialate O-acetylesterase [Candidatus Paceibacterota bacterium]
MKVKQIFNILIAICLLSTGCSNSSTSSLSSLNSQDTSSTDEEDNLAQVIVLLGQSNMEGTTWNKYLTNTMPDKASEYATGYNDVKIAFSNSGGYTSNNQFVPVKLGQGYTTNYFGPEVGIAETIHNSHKKNVFLIKYAIGGTTLSGHWAPPTNLSPNGGTLYKGALNFILDCIDELENMGYYPEIKAICWMQGESDATGNQYENYYILTKNFIKDLRNDLKLYMDLDGIGFLDAAIAALDHVWTEHVIINNAKKQNAAEDPLSYFIDTNAEGLKTNHEPVGSVDIYHYDSDSMIKLGRLFGMLLIEHFVD